MGWKASCIFINKELGTSNEKFLKKLGLNFKKTGKKETFENVMMPEEEGFFIGQYDQKTIICDYGIPFDFYSDQISTIEQSIIKCFPSATILVVTLMSVVNHYGFAIIENGKKIRVKVGDSENPVALEFGQITNEEIELKKESVIDEEGNRMFKFDDELFSEDAIGEEYIFEMTKRVFGFRIDESGLDDLFFETELEMFLK